MSMAADLLLVALLTAYLLLAGYLFIPKLNGILKEYRFREEETTSEASEKCGEEMKDVSEYKK